MNYELFVWAYVGVPCFWWWWIINCSFNNFIWCQPL